MEKDLYIDAFIKLNNSYAIIDDIFAENINVSWFNNEDNYSNLINKNLDFEIIEINKNTLSLQDKVKINKVFYPESQNENPHDTIGTIIDYDGYWFYVDWNNRECNTYRGLDIDLEKI